MSLFLIRHLPTEWNQKGLLQGKNDISILPVTEDLNSKIKENKKEMLKVNFDEILVSSLKRTRETAIIYGYKKFKIEPLIDELDFGIFEGKEKRIMLNKLGSDWNSDVLNISLGETMISFEKRVTSFLYNYKNKNVLAFAHGAVIRSICALVKDKTIKNMNQFNIENNSLTVLPNESINCS